MCQSNTQTFVTGPSVAYKLLGTVVASIRNKEGCLGKTLPDLHRYLHNIPYDPFSCTVQSGRIPPVPSSWQSFLPQYATRQKTFFFLRWVVSGINALCQAHKEYLSENSISSHFSSIAELLMMFRELRRCFSCFTSFVQTSLWGQTSRWPLVSSGRLMGQLV